MLTRASLTIRLHPDDDVVIARQQLVGGTRLVDENVTVAGLVPPAHKVATRAIRALEGPVSKIPIVAITANALRGDMETYLAAGMNGYVSKPIRIDALREAMEQAVPLSERDQRLAG